VLQESLYDLWCRKSNFAALYPTSYDASANASDVPMSTNNGAATKIICVFIINILPKHHTRIFLAMFSSL
jgi:hypothetical protein